MTVEDWRTGVKVRDNHLISTPAQDVIQVWLNDAIGLTTNPCSVICVAWCDVIFLRFR